MSWLIALLSRIVLLVVWLATPFVSRAFQGGWILPLLGILFLPITALVYVLVFTVYGGVTGWSWLWVALAVLIDLAAHSYPARNAARARRIRAGSPA